MRLQGNGISQSDTLSAHSPSLANNRAVRYKLPRNSVRMALRHLESVEDAAENSTSCRPKGCLGDNIRRWRGHKPSARRGRQWNGISKLLHLQNLETVRTTIAIIVMVKTI